MADIYLKRTKIIDGEYWQLVGIRNVRPEERSGLSILAQEYQIVSGDIGTSRETVDKKLSGLRGEMEADGHRLHYLEAEARRKADSYALASSILEKKIEPWIGVDLDGTLAKHLDGEFDPEKIGEPVPAMLRRVKRWLKSGKRIKIFTARAAEQGNTKPIKAWLKQHGLGDLEITNEKDPGCIKFWDDRAVAVEQDTGKRA
jgi:hypothetical protein